MLFCSTLQNPLEEEMHFFFSFGVFTFIFWREMQANYNPNRQLFALENKDTLSRYQGYDWEPGPKEAKEELWPPGDLQAKNSHFQRLLRYRLPFSP